MTPADQIISLFETRGQGAYFGERVSQLEHALQSAHFAQKDGAGNQLIVAALLHDVGHLLHDQGETIADEGVDTRHEELGEAWLKKHFPASVYEPVHLHVAAKRYLCATDKNYFRELSPASVQSLQLQGGPMSESEVATFESNPFFKDAVRLRHWDDLAKIVGLEVAPLKDYREMISSVAIS